jgi:putative membrane protein
MTSLFFVPLHSGFGPGGPPWAGSPLSLIGAFMGLLFLLLILGAVFLLLRSGKFGPPPWVTSQRSPETEAKRILSERFARGELSTDEFMERASVLNWTPGSDPWESTSSRKKK